MAIRDKNVPISVQRDKFIKACKALSIYKPPVKVFAIDPSRTHCGWAFYGKRISFGTIIPPKIITTFSRAVCVADNIGNLLDKYKPQFVFMEEYAFGEVQGRELAGEVQGLIMERIFHRKIPFMKPTIWQIKNFIGAKEKSHIMMEVLSKYKFKTKTDDEAEAIVIAMLGRTLFDIVYIVVKSGLENNASFSKGYKSILKAEDLTAQQGKTIFNLVYKKGLNRWL